MLDKKTHNMTLEIKFVQNLFALDAINSSLETIILDTKEMLGILDLRSIRYYNKKQEILQEN